MIKAASIGLGWWSDELAKSIQGKSKKIKIVNCYSKSKKKRIDFSKKNTLFPKKDYWKIMSITSIANGLMESVLERRMESIRPYNEKSNNFINKQEIRIIRTIKWLENNWNNYDDSYLTMDQISIACALDYTMFRFNDKWRTDSSKLNKWFSNFVEKDFMKSTLPREK